VDTAQNMVSLNYDGSLSLRSTNFSTMVHVDSKLFATMLGVSVTVSNQQKCPANSTYDHVFSDDAGTYGDGFCVKLITTGGEEQTYKGAVTNCYASGGRLCRVSEFYKACRDRQTDLVNSHIGTTFMTADFGRTGAADGYMTFTVNTAGCVNSGDFAVATAALTDTNLYACCINP
jgi:hypothetical protein